ncbi:TadE family protein [Georgenia subflava]|uniref:Pilus assembly protein n=1 Tax=Georgenia subflava TaxID=1622177 RepID=A0A6N7EKD4_9MICO|nr:TadE family protein [Georgenia subflava]MPV37015.1 pilus assembly protein [Georgenia subflava]
MSKHQDERGAAAVEFALVVPLLILLVLGIAEFGRAYHLQTTLSGAAREGVRVMALQDDAAAARATARAAAPGLDLTDTQIEVSPSSCAVSATSPVAQATVTVTYPMDFITGAFGADLTLTGKGTMRCNG